MNRFIPRISFSLIMTDTNDLIAKHRGFWLGVFVVYYIPLAFLQLYTSEYSVAVSEAVMSMDSELINEITREYRPQIWTNIALALVGLLFFAFNAWAVFRFWGGKSVDSGELLQVAFSKWLPLIGTALLMGVLLIVPFLFFVLPGVFLAVCWSMALYFVLFLDLHYADALKASYNMVLRRWWTIFLLFVSIFLAALFIGVIIGLLFFWAPDSITHILGNLITAYVNIFLVVAFLHIYNHSYPPSEQGETEMGNEQEFLT